MRPYAGEADLPAIADLLNACEAVDRLDAGTSVEELRQEFADPDWDLSRDLRLWCVEDRLIGFGAVWVVPPADDHSGYLWFNLHPTARGSGLETQILAWAEQRMREVAHERGVCANLRAGARASHHYHISLLEQHGFTRDRYFYRMTRPLADSIPEAQFPAGFSVRQVEVDRDAIAWVEMFNQSFIDHWNHHPLTIEQFKHYRTEPDYNPELDRVAVAADGTFAAFCTGQIYVKDNQRNERNEGWINVLGTRRGFRRLGLGRAMLLSGLEQLRAIGVETALLGVDSENPSGALRLYKAVGFTQLHTSIAYMKAVRGEG
ncbi:MAG: GNAT family N-acetyltransferase [Lyngbya sp. HA4199-MV5]|jgi:mycothiol synthase|nr:GNAT family N-acetyltransferase [Lyngbya sp. HA4199-MV5]